MSSLNQLFNIDPGSLAFIGSPGYQEMMIVGIIALLLFGKRLPEVARNLGRGFAEFKKGVSGFQDEFQKATREVERPLPYSPPASSSSSSSSTTRSSAENRPTPTTVPPDDEFTAPKFDLE